MRIIVTGDDTAGPGTGGVAYIGSFAAAGTFGVPDDVLCWAFEQSDANSAAEAISHELGHTLGLSHDGRDIPARQQQAGQGGRLFRPAWFAVGVRGTAHQLGAARPVGDLGVLASIDQPNRNAGLPQHRR